jgi:diketogulonate reductase-like aldo/keto reductase
MRFDNSSSVPLPKIGLGTARLGGRIIPNRLRDPEWMAAMLSALELGYSHFDTAELYALGYSEEIIGRAIQDFHANREKLFITTKAWLIHLDYRGLLQACENSLRRLGTDYIDLYLIHMPNRLIPLEETFRGLNQLVTDKKVRYLGVSNFNLTQLKEAIRLADVPLITNQIPYNPFERRYRRNGVIHFCQEQKILVTAYSPLRSHRFTTHEELASIAEKHQVTVQQIALSWLTSQPGIIAIPMSFDPIHQKQNLDSLNINLSQDELEKIEQFE